MFYNYKKLVDLSTHKVYCSNFLAFSVFKVLVLIAKAIAGIQWISKPFPD